MKLAVLGNGQLANSVRELTAPHHEIVSPPQAEVTWACADTPVDTDGVADYEAIAAGVECHFSEFQSGSLVLLSSQVPPGFTQRLRYRFRCARPVPEVEFAYCVENIKDGAGAAGWHAQKAWVIGTFGGAWAAAQILRLLKPFGKPIVWMGTPSAELAKLAINGLLATCIEYVNEIADIASTVGADPRHVEQALRTDARLGNCPLRPGEPFGPQHLGRDLKHLVSMGNGNAPALKAVFENNNKRRGSMK